MTQDPDIDDLLSRARRAAPSDAALDRVWRRLQAPPPFDPDGEPDLDPPPIPDLAPAAATLGQTLLVGAAKAVVAVVALVGAVAVVSRSVDPPPAPAPAPASIVTPTALVEPAPPPRITPPLAAQPEPAAPPAARPASAREPPAPDTDLAAERDLLSRAQAAHQRKDLAAARARLDEHAARFPTGLLADERQLLRVLTLCDAGDEAGAEAIARALLASRGAGLSYPRLRASCVGERLVPLQRPGPR